MHEQLLYLCDKHHIDVEVLTLFNEIYYQCVRLQYDGSPDGDLRKRYMVEETVWLKSQLAAELVFSMVWALYSRKYPYGGQGKNFLEQFSPVINDSLFNDAAVDFIHFMEEHDLRPPRVFSTMPISVGLIPKRIDLEYHTSMTLKEKIFHFFGLPVESSAIDFNPWRNVTNNYSYRVILFYIKLYKDRESQLELLERIKSACTKEEYKAHKAEFEGLKSEIRWGEYVPLSDIYADDDDDWDTLATDAEIRYCRLNCGKGGDADGRAYVSEEEYETATSTAMAASAGQLIGGLSEEQLRDTKIRSLIGTLLAAKAYSSYEVFVSYSSGDADANPVVDFLKRTLLKVEVDDQSGQITTSSEVTPRPISEPCSLEKPKSEEKDNPVTVEAKDGKTVYVIQNLYFNLTAEMVQQLNVNPQEVINHIHGQIDTITANHTSTNVEKENI